MLCLVAQRILNRQARLADPAEPIQRLPDHCVHPLLILGAGQGHMQPLHEALAAFEEGTKGGVGEIARFARWGRSTRLDQEVEYPRGVDICGKAIWTGEGTARIAFNPSQPL